MAYNGGEDRLKGLGEHVCGGAAGQVLTGEFWNLAIYGKGLLHQTFLDHRHWASGRFHLPVLVVSPCFGSHGGGGVGEDLVPVQLEVKVLSCAHASDVLGVLSLKCNSGSGEKHGGPF